MTLKRTLETTRSLAIHLALEDRPQARPIIETVRLAQRISGAVLASTDNTIMDDDASAIAAVASVFAQAITASFDDAKISEAKCGLATSIRRRLGPAQRGRLNSSIDDAVNFIIADGLFLAAAQVVDARARRRRVRNDIRKRQSGNHARRSSA